MDGMEDIIKEFLVESNENLTQLDQHLVALEQDPDQKDLLASIFRTIHTIKGTSGFLAFDKLEKVTHIGENLLQRLRDGEMVMSAPVADALLSMVDRVRDILNSIEEDSTEGDVEVGDVVARIEAILNGDGDGDGDGDTDTDTEANTDAVDDKTADEPEDSPTVEATPDAGPVVEPTPVVAPTAPAAPKPPTPAPSNGGGAGKRSVAESSVRVDVDLLDSLMRHVGELVLSRNQIVQQSNSGHDPDFIRTAQRLNLVTSELQEGILKTRMQTIDRLWAKLPRIVRDLGSQVNKDVKLEMAGRDTELDRSLLEAVNDPMTHLVRNAVDHGLESPEDRIRAGKPKTGVLSLSAYHAGGQVVVEVTDDGAGIDPEKIKAKALERGLKTPEELDRMTKNEVLQLIFLPGFSTAAAITNVSGRGVGMDVVRTNIEKIGGTVEIESTHGTGTTCRLRIPLTLAIMPALTVECSGDKYAIPQINLLELVSLTPDAVASSLEDINGAQVYRLRGDLLPLVTLSEVLKVAPNPIEGSVLAVLASEGGRFGLILDRVLNAEEIVVKPLSALVKSAGVYSGATVLGDGTVALLLDVQSIATQALGNEKVSGMTGEAGPPKSKTEQVLVVGVGEGRQLAVPLARVTRLEQIDTASIETVGNREVVQYRGEILPLLRLGTYLAAPSMHSESTLLMIYTNHSRSVAIAVDKVIDIVEVPEEQRSDMSDYGLVGSAVLGEKVTELLDVRSAILAADPQFFDEPEANPEGDSQ